MHLYFLQTRYYDPETGRFISQDSIDYADPETINGLNLYAYCANNPVMNIDPNGTSLVSFLVDILVSAVAVSVAIGVAAQVFVSAVSYLAMALGSIFDSDIRKDMININWNPFNSNENAVLSSNKVSFYKGVPIIRIPSDRSGTFLIIFLRDADDVAADEVRHEYGHIYQQMLLGPIGYGLFVFLPSALEWGPWSSRGQYYSAPWETMADMFGGVKGSHTTREKQLAIAHLITAMFFGPLSYLYAIG